MHRLFHSLVVCGAGLTLVHCGGQSQTDDENGGAGSSGAANAGRSGGDPGGAGAMGGAAMGGAGPATGGTGGSVGGATSTAGASSGGSAALTWPDGPTEQWTCDVQGGGCWIMEVVAVEVVGCERDESRPAAADACPPDTKFACFAGLRDGQEVAVNCECVPVPTVSGECPCPELTTSCFAVVPPPECADVSSICGCAHTCIAK